MKRKGNSMNRRISLFLAGCLLSGGCLYAQKAKTPMLTLSKTKSKVNLGIKGGFNSSMFFTDEFMIGTDKVRGLQNNYKVGYFGAFFIRFNMKKHHFLQPEFSYNVSKGSVSIQNNIENSSILPGEALIKNVITSINFPLLYGYKFIDAPPYGMAFFVGPQVAWTWRKQTSHEFTGFYQQNIQEQIHPFNYSAVIGLAVNVSNIFFDFRYEIGIHNLTESVTYSQTQTAFPYNEMDILLKYRRNVMSFSVGVMF